jgi:N-acetylmuramoyl-L-alanine amidase
VQTVLNIKKKLFTVVLAFATVLSLITTLNTYAATSDLKIISDTKVTATQVKKWAKSKGATDTFISLADLYFKYASQHGKVNPAIAYVQAAKETGYGRFGGVLDESFHNPCGLKKSDNGGDTDPNAHHKFASWDEGVQAHLDHLALYAGAAGYPRDNTYDPRHFVTIKGIAITVDDLGGKWAPSSTYGEEVNKLYQDLMNFSGITSQRNTASSNNKNNKSNSASSSTLNSGKTEGKLGLLSPSDVIPENKPQSGNKVQDNTHNIISTIGWKQQDGDWYYYKSDNTKAIGWIKPDGNWYYLEENDGKMARGWVQDNGKWYYFENYGAMAIGWKKLDEKWYFLTNSGAMATGIQCDGSNLYYFNDSGVMFTDEGWIKINDKWYYFEKGGNIKTGWFKDNNKWYYLQGNGSMVTGLRKINGKTYMFNTDGTMTTGWMQLNNYWYYFNTDGSLGTGWILDNGNYYYLYDTGAMATGWVNTNGAWYHLKDNGAMETGWYAYNGDSYYLDPNTGRMVTNATIDGYIIGSDGKCQSSSYQDNTNTSKLTGNSSNGKRIIAIDPGHDYGHDEGVVCNTDGVTYSETDLDIQIAVKLKSELEKRGYNVVMTRNQGETPDYGSLAKSLAHRVDRANDADADFFISIHHNAVDGIPAAKGVETYYSVQPKDSNYGGGLDSSRLERSKQMAKVINDSIVNKIGANNRGAKSDASAAVKSLFVLRNTKMPAVLVEAGFLSNSEEAVRCADPASQQKVAEAIAEAIAANI